MQKIKFLEKYLSKKTIGIFLMTFGIATLLGISLFAYSMAITVHGFPEILPANETNLFVRFPTALPKILEDKINAGLSVNWTEDILPWAGDSAGLAFISKTPLMMIRIADATKAINFLKEYKNKKGKINESKNGDITVYSTASLFFARISDMLIFAPTGAELNEYIALIASSNLLGSDSRFTKISRQNGQKPYFLFAKPSEIAKQTLDALSKNTAGIPFMSDSMSEVGISAIQDGNKWIGSSYTIGKNETKIEEPMYFRALLLQYMPDDFDFLIGGMNLAGQINKIDELMNSENSLPKLSTMMHVFIAEYLPGINFGTDIAPLLTNEFAVADKDGKVIVVSELRDITAPEKSAKIFEAFKTAASKLTPEKRDFTLADGTTAQELFADSSKVVPYAEDFEQTPIKGLVFNKNGNGIFYAIAQTKLFVSNDLQTLKRSLSLTREPGANFLDGQTYKESLRPILKNPEFFGVMADKLWTFGFSKRMFPDHMETDFLFRIL